MSNIENLSSTISLLSLCSGNREQQHNSKFHMWWWTWYESSSESGRVEAKTKKTWCCLGFHQPCWLHLSWTSVLTSHPVKYLFLCSETVTHLSRLLPSASWSTVSTVTQSMVASGSVDITKSHSCYTGIKTCFWWGKSVPAPFQKLLPLLWNSGEGSFHSFETFNSHSKPFGIHQKCTNQYISH